MAELESAKPFQIIRDGLVEIAHLANFKKHYVFSRPGPGIALKLPPGFFSPLPPMANPSAAVLAFPFVRKSSKATAAGLRRAANQGMAPFFFALPIPESDCGV